MNNLLEFIDKIDISISRFIHLNIKNSKLDFILSRLNRGETFFIVFLIVCYFQNINLKQFGILVLNLGIVTSFSEKFVLFIKKKISRKRPLVRVMDKTDPNPDMKHSFPSAHAANSMTSIGILVFTYSFSPSLFLFSLFAGIGRLISLHHFMSDIMGGWLIGFIIAIANMFLLQYFNLLS